MTQTCQEDTERLLAQKRRIVHVAAGREPADLVLKNAAYVNIFSEQICTGDIAVAEGTIAGVGGPYRGTRELDLAGGLVLPGLVDAHIHLESAMVSPGEFARAVLPHGTTTVIADPHEIANVMGADGISYMLQATQGLPLDVYFMLPSCVPAAPMDESGAALDRRALEPFYDHPRVLGLAEVMDYVGTAAAERRVLEKLAAAQARGGQVDGHAPGLTGYGLNAYVAAGARSDHECSTLEEALEKLALGQHIMIREGTAAQNLAALLPLLTPRYADRCMFCCDDRHPGDLLARGHIDGMVRAAVRAGADPILAVKAASFNAARYFRLDDRGAVAPGYLADLVVIDNFRDFTIQQVFKRGEPVYSGGELRAFEAPAVDPELARRALDTFRLAPLAAGDFRTYGPRGVIGLVEGEILTEAGGWADGVDLEQDILKVAVIERHRGTGHIGVGYLRGYGLKEGAVASSVAHDSHNIIVAGTDEGAMAAAADRVAENRGGIVVWAAGGCAAQVALPIAGLMSPHSLERVDRDLEAARAAAFRQGVRPGIDPFMTLSFLALPVIPALRLTTRGVFDVTAQRYL